MKNKNVRALLLSILALSLFGFAAFFLSEETPLSSPEKGFVSYSPSGEKGGAIIPASCESGWDDALGGYTYGQYGSCQIIPNLWASPTTINYGTNTRWGYNASPLGMMVGFGSNRRYNAYCNVYVNGGIAWGGAPTAYSWNWGPNYGTFTVGVQCFNSPYQYPGPYQQATITVNPPNACYPGANPPGYGSACTSAPNACGQTSSGTIACNGACSAGTPSNAGCNGVPCTSSPNACGQTNGTYNASGTCAPPSNASCNGVPCTSAPNACGQRNGTYNAGGACVAPGNPAGYGTVCSSPANICGSRNQGTIQCNGTCSAQFPPADPVNYGSVCVSAANSCGLRNTGTIGCAGTCTGATPSEAACSDLNFDDSCMSLTATPVVVGPSGSSTLTWSSTCGGTCALYNMGNGQIIATSTSGTRVVGPITAITRYALTCNAITDYMTVSPSNARSGSFQEF